VGATWNWHANRAIGYETGKKKEVRSGSKIRSLFLKRKQLIPGGFDSRGGVIYHLTVKGNCCRKGICHELMENLERLMVEKVSLRCYLLITKENPDWQQLDIFATGNDLQ
jgi:hypothetical protein